MKKIRLNTRFLATEGIPQLLTVAMIPFTMIVYFSGWLRGGIETTICASVFFLCSWSLGYAEWKLVRGKISKLHFGIFCASFLFMMAVGAKLYAMTDTASSSRLFILAVAMAPCLLIGVGYNNAIRKAELYEEKDRGQHIAVAGYHALWTIVIFLIAYSACFWIIFYFGDALSNLLGITRLESWQVAMHNMLD